jgi:CheY-like chemotaxis protein
LPFRLHKRSKDFFRWLSYFGQKGIQYWLPDKSVTLSRTMSKMQICGLLRVRCLFYIKRLAELGELANIITIYNTAQGAIDYLLHHKKSAEHLPDIILLDIYMPEVDGWEFLSHLIKIEPQLTKKPAVYIISSSSHPRDLDRPPLTIVRHYFQKP